MTARIRSRQATFLLGRTPRRRGGASLSATARSVRLVEARAGKDAADHLAAGLGLHDFLEVALPTALDGAALLHEVEQFIRRYVLLPSDAAWCR